MIIINVAVSAGLIEKVTYKKRVREQGSHI